MIRRLMRLPAPRRRPRGQRRLLMNRAQLRAWCRRCEQSNDHLAEALIVRTLERDGARAARDDATAAVTVAALRIADLEEQTRDAAQLRADNIALRARLANVAAVRPLTAVRPLADDTTVPTDVRRIRTPSTQTAGSLP